VKGGQEGVETDVRRRFGRAGTLGAGLATAVFVAVLVGGDGTLLSDHGRLSRFYDEQARSLLDLRWDVPRQVVSIEGFRVGQKTYMYFGPFPALLRLPVVAVTERLDGRLTSLSLLLAFVVAMVFTVRLAWRIRPLVRPGRPFGTGEAWAVGGLVFLTGVGTVLLFLGAEPVVFHEAELWAIALALGAFDLIIGATQSPTTRRVLPAGLLALLTVLTRGVVGAGPVLALLLLAAAALAPATRRLVGLPEGADGKAVALRFAVVALVPIALYAYVNYAKFGSLFSLPFEKQVATLASADHRRVLAANDGSLVGPQFVPTTLLQYFRPDALRINQLLPWVTFPGPASVIGDVTFDQRNPTSSVIDSMLLSSALAVVGIVALVRVRVADAGRRALAVLRVPVVAAAVASTAVLAFGFIAQRYLGDFVPVVVLLATIGLFQVVTWVGRISRPAWRRLTAAGLVLLGVVSVWWSVGLTTYHQQASAVVDDAALADFVRLQYDVHDRFPGGAAPYVERRAELPSRAGDIGTVVVVGDCDGLYWSSGARWRALERTPATGRFDITLQFEPAAKGTRESVLATGAPGDGQQIAVVHAGDRRASLEYVSEPSGQRFYSRPFALRAGRARHLRATLDRTTGQVVVELDGRGMIAAGLYQYTHIVRPLEPYTVGEASRIGGPAGAFAGPIRLDPARTPLCRQLTS
jgi:hypothetical protein